MGVEALLLLAILQQPQASVSEHAIAIHQEQLDAGCAPLYRREIFHDHLRRRFSICHLTFLICHCSKSFPPHRLDRALVPPDARRTSPLSKRCGAVVTTMRGCCKRHFLWSPRVDESPAMTNEKCQMIYGKSECFLFADRPECCPSALQTVQFP